jgi:threonine aldolase
MSVIDLRSDTVTRPSPEMRRAMAEAVLGDDVLGDDPTVNALEERAADLLGKEAALFVSSGTQGNLVAQLAHLSRGMETIAGAESHIVVDEAGGHAALVRTTVRAIPEEPDGTLALDAIASAFREDDVHDPITGMVALENTHAMSMAQPLSVAYTQAVADLARAHRVPLHIDGARFFNAVVAQGVTARDLAGPADSVTFCLSKALACPIGSMLVGSKEFIFRARRARKQVGGGMRQVGVLAACGLIALRDGPSGMIERLAEDHAHARRLADAIAGMDGVLSAGGISQPSPGRFDPARVTTNFLLFRVDRDRGEFLEALASRGVWMVGYPHNMIRAVPHYGLDAADIETAIVAVAGALRDTIRPKDGRAVTAATAVAGPGAGPGTAIPPTDPARPRVVIAH